MKVAVSTVYLVALVVLASSAMFHALEGRLGDAVLIGLGALGVSIAGAFKSAGSDPVDALVLDQFRELVRLQAEEQVDLDQRRKNVEALAKAHGAIREADSHGTPWFERAVSTIGVVAFFGMLTTTTIQVVSSQGKIAKAELVSEQAKLREMQLAAGTSELEGAREALRKACEDMPAEQTWHPVTKDVARALWRARLAVDPTVMSTWPADDRANLLYMLQTVDAWDRVGDLPSELSAFGRQGEDPHGLLLSFMAGDNLEVIEVARRTKWFAETRHKNSAIRAEVCATYLAAYWRINGRYPADSVLDECVTIYSRVFNLPRDQATVEIKRRAHELVACQGK